jgi:predicted enzyme related to lactoylglutathione lyase
VKAKIMTRHQGARKSLTPWSLAALLGTLSAVPALAASFELPALVQPATQDRHPGKVVWVDLVTPDLDGAKRFYSGLFGWTFRDVRSGDKDFALALLDGRPVGGLVQRAVPKGQQTQPAWLTFIAVRDVGEAERQALAHGGKVLSKAREYPQRGRQEILADPQGAVFAVLASSSGDPADLLAEPGDWIWSSLITSDPNAGGAFYQALFDYEIFDLKSDDDRVHLLLATDGYARASANPLPADPGKRHAHWINFVRVVSTRDAAAKAVALGGRVLVEPHTDRHGGMVAVVADPSGAPFGLLEWSDTESKEVEK